MKAHVKGNTLQRSRKTKTCHVYLTEGVFVYCHRSECIHADFVSHGQPRISLCSFLVVKEKERNNSNKTK